MTEKKIFFDSDLDTSILSTKQIGLVGYGSQGRAQALNLRDSGFSPLIGVRAGESFDRASEDGFRPLPIAEISTRSDIIVILTPDETHGKVCRDQVLPSLKEGSLIGFGAGFSIHFGLVEVPEVHKVFLVAPKGPGRVLRQRFMEGSGIPALVASNDGDPEGMHVAMAYAKAIGCGRAGVMLTTFREEAVADLFGEQCVLSGGMIELMKAAFDVLVERGYAPEVAYIECIAEVEYMASLISRVGLAELADHISSTAYYGGATRGERVIDRETRRRLQSILEDIESGKFLEEFRQYVESGKRPSLRPWDSDVLERARKGFRTVA